MALVPTGGLGIGRPPPSETAVRVERQPDLAGPVQRHHRLGSGPEPSRRLALHPRERAGGTAVSRAWYSPVMVAWAPAGIGCAGAGRRSRRLALRQELGIDREQACCLDQQVEDAPVGYRLSLAGSFGRW